MVAACYGDRSSLRELRSKFRVSLRGMTLKHVRDCAEALGFRSRAVRLDLDELAQLRLPAILHWDLNHFVVLEGVRGRKARIVDPAVGTRILALDEIGTSFTGVALELAPTPNFRPRTTEAAIGLPSFASSLRGLAGPLATVFTLTVVLQVFALIMPVNTQLTVDHGIRQGDMNLVFALAAGFALIGVVGALTDFFRSLLLLYVGNTAAFRMVAGLAHHLIRLPDPWFDARHTGDVLSRFGSLAPIRQFLTTGAFAMVLDAVMAVGTLAVMFVYSWDLTLVMCAFLALFAGVNWATYMPLRNLTHESIAAGALENSTFIENVERHRAIKLLGAQTTRDDAWGRRYVDSLNAGARLTRFRTHLGLGTSLLATIESVVVLLLGASKVITGEFSLGMLFAYTSYSAMFSARVHSLIAAAVGLRMLRLHQERVADIGLTDREAVDESAGTRLDIQGRIQAEGVSYAYGEEGPALADFSLDVAPGEIVAIAGESGSGKSTLVKLLAKLLLPDEGSIRIDGVETRQLDTAHFRNQLGVVMQDDDLFSGSLIENISMDVGAPIERVEHAARIACIHDDIEAMPLGYQTLVGHMGSTLSGGQRQRVMIARAVFREPRLLLLDEGTAHLDGELQEHVLKNLRTLEATIVAVTHDPRVLELVDRTIRI